MRAVVRQPEIGLDNKIYLSEKDIASVQVSDICVMSIDGSTTNTGVGILRKRDGALLYSLSFSRDKDKGETPVQYKVRLKKEIMDILIRNTLIDTVYYEEPFIGYASSVSNLMMLRTFIEEIIVECEPALNYIKHSEIHNKRWKKLFLAPDKCPTGTDKEKMAVRAKLESYMPFLSVVTQDEIDAISMGFVATVYIRDGLEDRLESKKKVRPFKYNMVFIGADEDDHMLMEFGDVYRGPQSILENGVCLTYCKGTENFDKHVYNHMGTDDKVLIVKFNSNKHCNLVLQHRIGHLASSYEYIYAIIWRQTRK